MTAAISEALPLHPPGRQGEIHTTTIPYLFHELWDRRASGVLIATRHAVQKRFEFDRGVILTASSNDRDERFSQVLLRYEALPLRIVMRALEVALGTSDRLGEVLVRMGLMPAEEVEKWVRIQMGEMIHDLFRWTEGQFHFLEKQVRASGVGLGVTAEAMVIEGIRHTDSWIRAFEQVGGLNAEYLTTRDMPEIIRGLPLWREEMDLLELCRTPTSLGEMCEQSSLADCEVCKAVWALLVVGALMKA